MIANQDPEVREAIQFLVGAKVIVKEPTDDSFDLVVEIEVID